MRSLRIAGVAFGSALAGAALVVALVTGFSAPKASAGASPAVQTSSDSAQVGDNAVSDLSAINIGAPGLGAWSVNVTYDPSIVQLLAQPDGCVPGTGGVCNPAFSSDTIRVAGASAMGTEGDTLLATITFRCIHIGQSPLAITIDTIADATPGEPQDIPAETIEGAITCQAPPTPALPTTAPTARAPTPTPTAIVVAPVNAGFGSGSNGSTIGIWLVAGLIGAGIAWLSAGLAGARLATLGLGSPRSASVRNRAQLPAMRPARPSGDQPRTRPERSTDMPSFRPVRRPHDEQ